jgi:glycosyltransferase involved in cell wall biosynthesis
MSRVCMISQSNLTDPRVRREAEALADDGIEVDIICTSNEKNELKIEKFGLITYHKILVKKRYENAIRYGLHTFLFFILTFFKLQSLSLSKRYDLIQIHNMPEFHVFTAIFQKFAGIPVVLDIHDLTPELFECKWNDKKHSVLIKIVRFVEKISCRFSTKIITVTEICKEYLVKRGVPPEKITLILNTPDQKIFKFDPDREFKVINSGAKLIYHGTIAHRMGIHTAVEAVKFLNEKIPGSTLSLYGHYDYSYRIFLEKLIKQFNLQENICLHGEHTQEEIYGFIKHSDFGIVPYVDNEYMNLCLSTKMFEYNASLLPVVASRLKAFSAIFNDDSIAYSKPECPHDFAEKLISLCQDPVKRRLMVEKSYSVLQTISGQIMSERYLSLINSSIQEKKIIKVSTSGI